MQAQVDTLCMFRCMKLEQLKTHVSAHREHIDRVKRLEDTGEDFDRVVHFKQSVHPYLVAEGQDMIRLTAEESRHIEKSSTLPTRRAEFSTSGRCITH